MEIVYLLVPLAAALVGCVILALVWAVRSGQFDDLESPAQRILMDDDGPASETATGGDVAPTGEARSPRPHRSVVRTT